MLGNKMSLRTRASQAFGTRPPRVIANTRVVRNVKVNSSSMSQEEYQEYLKKAMQDPKVQEQVRAMQDAMQRPEMQQQMAQMQSFMANPQLQQKLQTLRNDPDFADFFKDLQTGGMQALMRYYNNPDFLAKLGEKLGDVAAPPAAAAGAGAAAAAAGAMPAQQMPEINDLLDAAKYGDEEAVEDFIAIGKDVAMADKEGRTPLHYACGFNHANIARMLLDEGAPIEATDSMGNTPLHYAAGYGRPQMVELLLMAGANVKAKNSTGKMPYDLATLDKRNPLSQMTEILEKLK